MNPWTAKDNCLLMLYLAIGLSILALAQAKHDKDKTQNEYYSAYEGHCIHQDGTFSSPGVYEHVVDGEMIPVNCPTGEK